MLTLQMLKESEKLQKAREKLYESPLKGEKAATSSRSPPGVQWNGCPTTEVKDAHPLNARLPMAVTPSLISAASMSGKGFRARAGARG